MTDHLRPTDIEQTVALRWLQFSLNQGSVVSPWALKVVQEHEGRSFTLAPDTVDPAQIARPDQGGVTRPSDVQEALIPVLDALVERGAACVLVEDELRRRRDPASSVRGLLSTAFVGERVLHWASLAESVESAMQVLHYGSHGYPLNAFVTSATETDLGLTDGAELNSDVANAVARSLVAIIVAAYDAESFLIWEPS